MVLWQRIKDLYKKISVSAKQTTISTEDGGTNVMTFTFGDGTSTTLSVKNGSKGSDGAKGATGAKGEKGDRGPVGETGAKGEKGDRGPVGATGAKGEKGDRGPVGETGPQGNSGIADASNKALINDAVTGGETSYLSAEVGKLGILTYDCSKGGTVEHASLQDAINAVPTTFRKAGITIIYKSGDSIYRYTLKSNTWSSDTANWFSVEDKLSDLSNSNDKIKTLLNSVEKDILGESILEYEVAVTGKYINHTGLEYTQSNSIITKPIQLYAGDKIKMIVNDSGFAIIAKPKVEEIYTPVYIYSGRNKLREYVVTEDMLVCFTIIEGSKITIVNGGISKNISEIKPKSDYAYDAILRTERGKKNILSVSDIKSGDVVDIVLLPDYSYAVSNYSDDNSAISIWAYDKTSNSYEANIVERLLYGNTAIVSVSKKVEAIIITSTSTNIKFDININGIVNRVELVEDAVSPRSIKDNLRSDGSIKRIADCIKNGKADSDYYGKENTRYKLNVKSGFDKLYMYFEWRATSAIDTRDTNKPIVLFSTLNGYARTYLFFEGLKTNNANLYRYILYGCAPRGKYSFSNPFSVPSDNETTGKMGEKYHNFVGMDALWIRYTGSASSASMKLLQDGIEFTLGDKTEKVTAKSGDLLLEVCRKINAIQDIECSLINGADNKTYNDVFYEDTLSIPLKYTFTSSNGMTINDSPRIYIPLKYDEKWHSCEVLVDVSKKIMYVNHDGFTVVTDLTTYKNGSNTVDYSEGLNNAIKSDICEICIGEDYNEGNIPLVFRNLEIEVGSDGGAEIIEARCPIPNSTGVPYDRTGIIQMISNHNPRVVLYEGHGILVGNDKDFPASENESFTSERSMACTTGRLMRLFEYAKNKGYEFVSWQDVVDWKINGKTLPKRSMSLMFDDFRVENYLDYDKRIPFRKFNVKPALCLITSTERFPLDGTITVNDKTYTRKEAIEICKTAGWYLTSHSHDHRNQDEIQPSAQISLLKTDALMADEYNINSDIITYGGANFRFYNLSAMKASSFSMGVNGMSQDYICKAINNFYINRVDIGLRLNWEKVIAPLA